MHVTGSMVFYIFRNLGVFLLGYFIGLTGFTISDLMSLANAQEPELSLDSQQYVLFKQTGEYFSDVSNPQFTINTYETLCKGYYTIETTPTETIYTGYGDLPDEYTYTIKTTDSKASSTPIDIEPIITEPPISSDNI